MATKYYYFSGIAKWVKKDVPDPEYGNYTMCLYVDKETRAAIKATGIRSTVKEDEEGFYYTFRRPEEKQMGDQLVHLGPPGVFMVNEETGELEDFEGKVGNGSKVTIKLVVYDGKMGKGSRWESLRVDELVEYIPNLQATDTTGLQGVPF